MTQPGTRGWIIEGLGLSPVTGGRYEMICLPVRLHGSDGAPARAVPWPIAGRSPDRPTTFTEAVSMAAQKVCRTIGIGHFPPVWSYLGPPE